MPHTFRPARESDVSEIAALINRYAAQNLMLPRSEDQIRSVLENFVVAEDGDGLTGCGSLVALTPRLAEIRSLAVAERWRGNGLGGQLIHALLDLAHERNLEQVCALTLRPNLFRNQGFQVVNRWHLTPKIWSECVYCPKFHRCDEVAVLLNLREPTQVLAEPPWWGSVADHMPLPVLRRFAGHQA